MKLAKCVLSYPLLALFWRMVFAQARGYGVHPSMLDRNGKESAVALRSLCQGHVAVEIVL